MAGGLTISTLNDSSGVLATQNGMKGVPKAWVNFIGSSGTISGYFNVSSITRNSAGRYVVNFTTAMPNANYAPMAQAGNASGNADWWGFYTTAYNGVAYTTTACPVVITNSAGTPLDPPNVNVIICGS